MPLLETEDKHISTTEIIFRGRAGHGVGESILEAYNKFLDVMGKVEKVILKTNGLKITIQKDWDS